jgi:hypothetical protein
MSVDCRLVTVDTPAIIRRPNGIERTGRGLSETEE